MGGFWTDNQVEPKRQFRFLLSLSPAENSDVLHSYYVRSAKLPQFQMDGVTEVKYVQHTFKYPGRITWQPIDVTCLPVRQKLLNNLYPKRNRIVLWAGYSYDK